METVTKFKCTSCEQFFDEEELVTMYQCNNCGTVFSKDNSADGVSHRCPDCNKFAAKLHDHGCPDGCEVEEECDEVQAAENDDGDWEEVIDDKPTVVPVTAEHFHFKFTDKDDTVVVNEESGFSSEDAAREYVENPTLALTKQSDGSYVPGKDYPLPNRAKVEVVKCDKKHDKFRLVR